MNFKEWQKSLADDVNTSNEGKESPKYKELRIKKVEP
jgi:hypothetical protein